MLLAATPLVLGEVTQDSTYKAPNIDQLIFSLKSLSPGTELNSLESGQIDMIPNVLTFEDVTQIKDNGTISIYTSPAGSTVIASLFFNCARSPLDNTNFRKALSHLVNRDYIAKDLLQGLAYSLDTFVPISNDWLDENSTAPECSPSEAVNALSGIGYTYDNVTNSWVNQADGIPLRELTLLTPKYEEAEGLWMAGDYVSWFMSGLGIHVKHVALAEEDLVAKIAGQRDFDMCLHGFNMGDKPYGLYGLLHASANGSSNTAFCGIDDPELDKAIEGLWFGVTRSETIEYSHKAQRRLEYLLPYVPVYSISPVAAVSPGWEGVINAGSLSVANGYTYCNVHRVDQPYGGKLVIGVGGDITDLNPLTFNEASAAVVLQLICSPLIYVDPVTLQDVPMLASSWQTQPWTTESGKSGMEISFHLRSDVVWQDGVTFNSSDVKFCIEYLKSNKVKNYQNIWSNLVRVEAPDGYTVNIFLNSTGYRYLESFADMTFLPEHIWRSISDYQSFRPWEAINPSVKGMTALVGQGPFEFKKLDQGNYLELVWNPLYFVKNSDKPELVVMSPANQSISSGGQATYSFEVKNFTSYTLNEPDITFNFSVSSNNGTSILKQGVILNNGKYEARIDTTKFVAGRYLCEFSALPYGTYMFPIVINQPQPTPTQSPSPTPSQQGSGVPSYSIEATFFGTLISITIITYLQKKKMP